MAERLRGPALQLAVVARAKDGYAVVFALAEFDESFSARTVLLADAEERNPPSDKAAPLELVAPGDQNAARWARMMASLEIVTVGAVVPRRPPPRERPARIRF